MARLAYTDITFLNFSPDATDVPTTTQITALITNYYIQAYSFIYPIGNYNVTDSDTTDPQGIIRSDEFFALLKAEISDKVQQWHDSGMNSDGQLVKMPSFKMSKEMKDQLHDWMGKTVGRLENIRVYGSDYDDAGVM